ncbi:MAG: ECF transporter S component [Oscillospiraceae bacterium]|nr:ECF transporter S component [Oscillospiraceae bacterium]
MFDLQTKKVSTKILTLTAVLMAMNVVMSSFSIPVPGGHVYLNDLVICTAAILLDYPYACIVGGIGAFLGDLIFYPTPMFVSLVVHGVQAVVVSLCTRKLKCVNERTGSVIGVVIGAVITVIGYHLGRAYIYSTPEYALLKLPFQIVQEVIGGAGALLLCWKCGLVRLYRKYFEGNM